MVYYSIHFQKVVATVPTVREALSLPQLLHERRKQQLQQMEQRLGTTGELKRPLGYWNRHSGYWAIWVYPNLIHKIPLNNFLFKFDFIWGIIFHSKPISRYFGGSFIPIKTSCFGVHLATGFWHTMALISIMRFLPFPKTWGTQVLVQVLCYFKLYKS